MKDLKQQLLKLCEKHKTSTEGINFLINITEFPRLTEDEALDTLLGCLIMATIDK